MPGTPPSRRRDALIVALLAYAGLRPGELRALRFSDVREDTISSSAQRIRWIKQAHQNERHRAVRLLAPLAGELHEYRLAVGRPSPNKLLLRNDDRAAWDKNARQMRRVDRRAAACRAVGLDPVPRPYDRATASLRCYSPRDASRSGSPASSVTPCPCCSRRTAT